MQAAGEDEVSGSVKKKGIEKQRPVDLVEEKIASPLNFYLLYSTFYF